jgi:probable F420-dependent oxidoreductase
MRIGVTVPMTAADLGPGSPIATWPDIRDFALRAEALGFDSLWVYDHLVFRFPDKPEGGLHEAWTILAALAAVTHRVRLGTLVLCTAFRAPAVLAKAAVALDDVSGGRLVLGLGAGWHEPEFEAFGLPFDQRVGRFEEALRIVRGLLDGRRVTHAGDFHRVRDAVLMPAPSRRIPILVAGRGPRMLRLTAELADAWNTAWFNHPDERLAQRLADLGAALEAAGRPRDAIERTTGIIVRDPAERDAADSPAVAFGGPIDELAEILDEHAAAGIAEVMVWLEPKTPANLERLAEAMRMHRARPRHHS